MLVLPAPLESCVKVTLPPTETLLAMKASTAGLREMVALPLLPWMKKDPLPGSAVSIENTHCPVPPNPPPRAATGAKPLPPDGGGGAGVSWACAIRGTVTNARVSKAAEVSLPEVPRGSWRYEDTKRFVGAVVMSTPYHARRERSNQGLWAHGLSVDLSPVAAAGCPSLAAVLAASSTARAMTERMRPSSMISRPAMVLPAGVVT